MSGTTLTEVHHGILAKIRERFPGMVVDSYEPNDDLSKLAPACLLELEEFSSGNNVGDNRYPARCRFSIHCILGYEENNRALSIREFAGSITQLVQKHGVWVKGSLVSGAENIEAYPGNFKKDTCKGYDSWVVSWEQTIYLGESMWATEGSTPQDVYFGLAPGGEVQSADDHEGVYR